MGFSGIGIWEIVLILVVIIIILGPHRLPEMARTLGKAFRAIKKAGSEISVNISKELEETKTQDSSPKTSLATTIKKPSPTDKPGPPKPDDQTAKPEGHQQKNE